MISTGFTLAGHSMGLPSLVAVGGACGVTGLGLYPLLSDDSLQESLFFFLFCLAVAVWLVGFGLMYGAPDQARASRWLRFAYVGVPIIPAILYTVAVHTLGVADERRTALGVLWLAAAFFLLLLLVGTDVVVEAMYRYDWGFYPDYSAAGAGFILYVAAGISAALAEYLNRYRTAKDPEESQRAKRYLLAFGVGSLAVIDFLPCYGVAIPPTGTAFIPIMAVLIGRTIRRHDLAEFTPEYAADQVLETMADPVLVVDEEGKIHVTNLAVEAVLGYREEDLRGAPVEELIPIGSEGGSRWSEILDGGVVRGREFVLEGRAGNRVAARVSASPLTDASDRRVGTVVVVRDVRERKALEHRALHDPLTGLPNRRLFRDRLEHAYERAEREQSGVAVLYLDLDGLKAVNDSLGHSAGDQLLEKVAGRLEGVLRGADTAARIGGDEFAVLLEEVGSPADVAAAAERIRRAFRPPFELEATPLSMSVSIGAAHSDQDVAAPHELLDLADDAMYRAKRGGSTDDPAPREGESHAG